MKKTLSILLIVATVLLVLVSCNSEQNFTEDLVSVSLKSATSKALSATNDFDVNNVSTWKYTAKKVNGGLKTGETTEQVELIEKVRTNPLSQGVWDFELYGYNSENKQICYGKVSNVKITVSEHTVSIVVAPSQTAQGTIAIGEIKLVSDTAEYSGSEYTQTVAIYAGKTKSGEPLDSYTSVNSGAYYVEVTLTGASVGDVHTGNTVINVYDNLTTTVTGTIKETTQAAEMNKKAEKITASEVATVAVNTEGKNTDVVKIEVASTPTGVGETTTTTAEGTTTTEKKTSVSFPVGALQVASTGSETTSKSVSLEITSAPIETAAASKDYAITTSDGAVVAGFDFNLTGVESTTFTEAVTIETYIATGLGTKDDLAIAYVGTETGTAPTIDSYDTTTGKIVFKVYHFSKYAIISNNFVATDSNGKLYETFDAAIATSNNITLLKDISLNNTIEIKDGKKVSINLNNHSIVNAGYVFKISNAEVDFSGVGTLETTKDVTACINVVGSTEDVANYSIVTVGKDVSLFGFCGIMISRNKGDDGEGKHSYGVVVDMSGDFTGKNTSYAAAGVYINGQIQDIDGNVPIVTIADSTFTKGGLYTAGYAKWSLKNCTMSSPTVLSIKSGEFIIDGGTYTSTGTFVDPSLDSSNASVETGAALSMTSNDGYAHKIDVTVKSGTFVSNNGYAVYEGIPNKKNSTTGEKVATSSYVTLDIQGGTFVGNSEKGAIKLDYMKDNNKAVVKGGSFNSDPNSYLASGYTATEADGVWTVSAVTASN